tara:strand:+ start:452 stop:928 length:477 start_codon:yes stop_codon:yes gene_type:complete
MTVKEKIMEALEGAIKDASRPMAAAFIQTPIEIYTDCEFDWDINLKFKDGRSVNQGDFTVECGKASEQEDAVDALSEASYVGGADSEMWPEVYRVVKFNFEAFLDERDDRDFLHQPAEDLDLEASNFFVSIFEIIDDGADIERWHRKAYYFQDMLEGK